MNPSRNRFLLGLALVFALALGLRFAHLAALRSSWEGTGLFSSTRIDARHHWQEALDIRHEDPLLRDRVYYKGPGYSYFLAGLMGLVGEDPGRVRWVLAVLGALNCVGLTLLARRFAEPGVALLTGGLAAVNGLFILYDGELYHPTLLIALSLGVLALLTTRRWRRWNTAAGGALLGISILVHPSMLIVALALLPWVFRVRGTSTAALFILMTALLVAPASLKNLLFHDEPLLVSSTGGVNLYVGNHPAYDPASGQDVEAWTRIMRTPSDLGMEGLGEQSRFFTQLALREMLRSPSSTIRSFIGKLRALIGPLEISSNFRIYELAGESWVTRLGMWGIGRWYVPFGLWGPAMVLGFVLSWRWRRPFTGLLLLFVLGVALTSLLFFCTARFRLPLVFVGALPVARFWLEAVRRVRAGDGRGLLTGAAAFIGLSLSFTLLSLPQRGNPPPFLYDEAIAQESEGNFASAEQMLRQTNEADPDEPLLRAELADFLYRRGRMDESRAVLQGMLDTFDLTPDLHSNVLERIGQTYLYESRFDEAEAAYRAALEIDADAAEYEGRAYYQLGLGPATACRLELALAEVDLMRGSYAASRKKIESARATCGAHGELGKRIRELDLRLSGWERRPRRVAPGE